MYTFYVVTQLFRIYGIIKGGTSYTLLSTVVSFVLLDLADRKKTAVALKKIIVKFYKFLLEVSEQPVSFLYALRLNSKVGY